MEHCLHRARQGQAAPPDHDMGSSQWAAAFPFGVAHRFTTWPSFPAPQFSRLRSGTRLQLWNYRADRFENDVEAHSDAAGRLFVSADGSLLVSAGIDAGTRN